MDRRKLKQHAREMVSKQSGIAKKVTVIYLVSVIALIALRFFIGELPGLIPVSAHRLSDSFASGAKIEMISFAITFALQLMLIILSAGYTAFALMVHHGEVADTGILLGGFYQSGRVILLYLLETIMLSLWTYVLSVIPAFLYSVFLITPGTTELTLTVEMLRPMILCVMFLMWIVSYRYRTSFFRLMANPQMSARFALSHAKRATRGYRFQLFLLDLSFLPWILLSILTCGILLVWKLPYIMATYAGAYEEIEKAYFEKMNAIFGTPADQA